jgi:hypothetical protein
MDALADDRFVKLIDRAAKLGELATMLVENPGMFVDDPQQLIHPAIDNVKALTMCADGFGHLRQEPIDRPKIDTVAALRHEPLQLTGIQ